MEKEKASPDEVYPVKNINAIKWISNNPYLVLCTANTDYYTWSNKTPPKDISDMTLEEYREYLFNKEGTT